MKSRVMMRIREKELSAKLYYLLFSFSFLILSLLVFSSFLVNEKSFIFCDWNEGGDGLVQHFNAFVYYGHYLRDIARNIFVEHNFSIPTWNMQIGYGQDTITTLSYYVIGDPFSALSALCPEEYAEYMYGFAILLRIFMAGITFSVYCRYHQLKSVYTLFGALIYSFSSYTLMTSVLHPYFTNPLVFLPLLLIGVDRILKKEGNSSYIAAIAISALSNFYFFYMLCIMVVIYTVFRYIMIFRKIEILHLLWNIVKFIVFSVLGLSIAMVLFLPSAMNILSSSRVSAEVFVPFLYDKSQYFSVINSLILGCGGYYVYMGYTALGFVSVVLLFIRIKKDKNNIFLALGMLLLLLFALLPFFGHMLNGMSYVTNRWIWAMAFVVALITVKMLPQIFLISKKEFQILLVVSMLYMGLLLLVSSMRNEKGFASLLGLAILLFVIYAFALCQKRQFCYAGSVFLLTVAMIVLNAVLIYGPEDGDYLVNFAERSQAMTILEDEAPGKMLEELPENPIYRYDTAAIANGEVKRNSSIPLAKNGTAYYFSTSNGTISQFMKEMYIKYSMEASYDNLDRRSYLDAIAAVKYVIIPNGKEKYLPYGYDRQLIKKGAYTVYTSDNALPFGYTSNKYISEDTYEKLDVVQKQQALLQGIVVEDAQQLKEAKLRFSEQELPVQIAGTEELEEAEKAKAITQIGESAGLEIEGNRITVKEDGAQLELSFEGKENCESYLIWENLNYQDIAPDEKIDKEEKAELSRYDLNKLRRETEQWNETTSTSISALSGGVSASVSVRNWKNPYYANRHNFISNLGYSEEKRDKILLTFQSAGVYTFDKFRLVCQPMKHFARDCEKLRKNTLHHIKIKGNTVSGSIKLKVPKLLCLAIPYSDGWTARVDGRETAVKKANGMFMALELSPGTHKVELRYETPYLKIGGMISIIGVVIFLMLLTAEIIFSKRK